MRLIVLVIQPIVQKVIASVTHAAQIDFRFCDGASDLTDFGVRVCPSDFARERFHLFGQRRIGIKRQAQTVATGVSRRAGAALRSFWAGAGPSICAVRLDLGVARQAAVFRLAVVGSTT